MQLNTDLEPPVNVEALQGYKATTKNVDTQENSLVFQKIVFNPYPATAFFERYVSIRH